MLFLVATVACLVASMHGVAAESCHMREVDLCLATVLVSATEGVPATDEEIDKVCEPVQEGMECMGNYSKSCFTPLLQEVYDMVMAEPMKYQTLMCTHGTDERAQYLKNAPCFQKVLSNDNVRPHLEDLMAALEKATESKFQDRIPIMCCGIQRLFKVTVDMVEKQCGKGVLEEGSMLIGMSASSLSDVFCRGYTPDSPKCALLPPSGTPSKGTESKVQLIQFMNTALANWQ
ncbi:uncharacterized protein LOC118188428 isoform X2 [Stegodyphus dumicola]|uniref:uncharacterized protein LOC118188428 isoform X2 n=1 Tax=Stegodyphus dumicola TaxID=202533 RepID=UPI0015AE27B2|nr:uncharacterized protein LOC118188428 isoform X2 [Stegodyphus dumicola]